MLSGAAIAGYFFWWRLSLSYVSSLICFLAVDFDVILKEVYFQGALAGSAYAMALYISEFSFLGRSLVNSVCNLTLNFYILHSRTALGRKRVPVPSRQRYAVDIFSHPHLLRELCVFIPDSSSWLRSSCCLTLDIWFMKSGTCTSSCEVRVALARNEERCVCLLHLIFLMTCTDNNASMRPPSPVPWKLKTEYFANHGSGRYVCAWISEDAAPFFPFPLFLSPLVIMFTIFSRSWILCVFSRLVDNHVLVDYFIDFHRFGNSGSSGYDRKPDPPWARLGDYFIFMPSQSKYWYQTQILFKEYISFWILISVSTRTFYSNPWYNFFRWSWLLLPSANRIQGPVQCILCARLLSHIHTINDDMYFTHNTSSQSASGMTRRKPARVALRVAVEPHD